MIVKSERILIFGFDVTQQEIEYQGMTFTPYKNKMGHITGLVIKGKEGTAVVTVEKGNIPLDQEFSLVFSEPLAVNLDTNDINTPGTGEPEIDLPVAIIDVTDTGSPEVLEIQTQLLNSGTEVKIKPQNQLKENHVYTLQTFDQNGNVMTDREGNPINIECNFRAKRSYSLYSESTNDEVYDTQLIGSRLFVAAGYDGLRVLYVSNPSQMRTFLTVPTMSTMTESKESTDSPLVFPDRKRTGSGDLFSF